MLENLHIKNFKSIADESIDLGRINVFIGENGSGKSNILEALMMASLAETYGTIDADILYTNGVRVSKPSLMMSNFEGKERYNHVSIIINHAKEGKSEYKLRPTDLESINSKWENEALSMVHTIVNKIIEFEIYKRIQDQLGEVHNESDFSSKTESKAIENLLSHLPKGKIKEIESLLSHLPKKKDNTILLSNFIIYTLNTEALRGIPEFQKSRKGIYGETLDKIITSLSESELEELKEHVYGKIEWLDDFFIDQKDELKRDGYKMNNSQSLLYFKDKYMSEEGKNNLFSAENSNEGILHLLFYLANIISTKTTKLFAIDNIETALNPRLCEHTMEEICTLAKKHDKQILITTHNPAILDGLNLLDDEIRLFEVFRLDNGETKTRRIEMKPSVEGEKYKLSELWTRGYLGAISDRY
jgi:AAA15 family ATPase/GTPase